MTDLRRFPGAIRIPRRQGLMLSGLSAMPWLLPCAVIAAGHQALKSPVPTFGRAKRCLLLFLTGGPPQHDTWDPKPDAPAGIRGEFSPIETSVPGVLVSEMFPRLAAVADRFRIVR